MIGLGEHLDVTLGALQKMSASKEYLCREIQRPLETLKAEIP